MTSFRAVALRGRPEFAGVLAPGIEYPLSEDLRVIPRVLMADGGPVQFTPGSEPPLPQQMVERFGVRSMLSMPVYTKLDEPARFHQVALHQCSFARVWAPHEMRLFHEIGRRLGDAVSALSILRDQRQSEARFRALVDFAADAVMLHAADGTVVDVNRQACESLGYSREELIGMTPAQFDAGLDLDALRRIAERVAAGETVTFETHHRRKDGTVFPVEVRGRQVWQGGRPFGISLSRDITERRRAEEERERLRQAQAELARISRVTTMGELTASLAHEVKQPIAGAITNANACVRWLAREHPDLAEARDAAARIVRDANRAAEIIERVRSLYRKDAARRALVDVGEVVRETVALLRTEASRHYVAIRVELAPDLPRVSGDRVQLQQVLMNLMLNGIEAMDELAGGVLTVEARRMPGGEALVTVSDEGVGLPEAEVAIFDAFFTTKPQGTGMGLTISRSIVEAHGGRLWALRRTGRGAAFHVALPPAESAPEGERVQA